MRRKLFERTMSSLLLCTLLFSRCSTSKGLIATKAGTYTVQVFKTKRNADPVVYGTLYNYHDESLLKTNGAVKVNDKIKSWTDINGNYTMTLKPGNYRFTAFGVPYQFLTTKKIKVSKGDSVKIVIYLKADDTPTYD